MVRRSHVSEQRGGCYYRSAYPLYSGVVEGRPHADKAYSIWMVRGDR